MPTTAIVTRESLNEMLQTADEVKRMHIIGRALVRLFERQTDAEQHKDETEVRNNVGFAGCDAKSGSLTAKSYLKNRMLQPWQVERWMRPSSNGFPRICRYARQLDEVAQARAKT